MAENDADDAFLIKRILQQACGEARIVAVNNGLDALRCVRGEGELVAEFCGPPAVVILDHGMPQQTGLAVLHNIRNDPALNSVPVVICSGLMTRAQVQQAYRLGANAYVEKPCDFERLRKVFHHLGEFLDPNQHHSRPMHRLACAGGQWTIRKTDSAIHWRMAIVTRNAAKQPKATPNGFPQLFR